MSELSCSSFLSGLLPELPRRLTTRQFDSAFASRLDSKLEHKAYLTALRDRLTGKSDPSPEEQLGTLFDHLSMVIGLPFPRGGF